MRRALLAALMLVLAASGCATRGTIGELGRPEFEDAVPPPLELTLVEPKQPGSFHAYPKGAGKGDYHCEVRMEEPPRHVLVADPKDAKAPPADNIGFVMKATPTGDRKLKRFEVLAWPLLAKDEIRFKEDGHPPGHVEPLRRVSVDKPIPDSESFGLQIGFPAKKLEGFDHIGVSALVVFEDGWVSIVDSAVLAPAPEPK